MTLDEAHQKISQFRIMDPGSPRADDLHRFIDEQAKEIALLNKRIVEITRILLEALDGPQRDPGGCSCKNE